MFRKLLILIITAFVDMVGLLMVIPLMPFYARKLGAEVHLLEGSDAIARILQFAHDERITQLFIGHTQHKAWAFWSQNPVERLLKAAEGIDVRLFPQTQAA